MSLTRIFPELFNANRLFPDYGALSSRSWDDSLSKTWSGMPAMDLEETPNSYIVKADVPGFKKDQIEINAAGNALTLTGRYVKTQESVSDIYRHSKERTECSFQRTVNLPMEIPVDKIVARMEDGVLTLEIPKSTAQPKRVTII